MDNGKYTGLCTAIAYAITILLLGFLGTVGCGSSLIFKGSKCDFNADAILLTFGILDWILCLVFIGVMIDAMAFVKHWRTLIAIPYFCNFGLSVWGTVMLSTSKTCKKTAASGPKVWMIGNLYEVVDYATQTGWCIFAAPIIVVGLLMLGGAPVLEMFRGGQSRSDSYGTGV